MLIDKEKIEIIAGYLRLEYKDDKAQSKLEGFLTGFDLGWQNAIEHAAHHVFNWHDNMDCMYDSTVKGVLSEVEGEIRELQFGDL